MCMCVSYGIDYLASKNKLSPPVALAAVRSVLESLLGGSRTTDVGVLDIRTPTPTFR